MTVFHPKTRDLESNGGIIYLVHDNERVVDEDIATLRAIEKNYFKLLLNDGMSRPWFLKDVEKEDPKEMLRRYDCHGVTLVAMDEAAQVEGIQCVTADTVSDAHKGFDNVIIAVRESLTERNETACLKLLFDLMDKAREGGRVIIPESTFRYISYGREGAEELMRVKGLRVQPSRQGEDDRVIGINE